jgi:hypothetical protein
MTFGLRRRISVRGYLVGAWLTYNVYRPHYASGRLAPLRGELVLAGVERFLALLYGRYLVRRDERPSVSVAS